MSNDTRRNESVVPDPVEVPVFGSAGNDEGTRTFAPGPVSNYPNIPLLKEAVRRYQGRLRRGTASTRTRAELTKSNHKPWRQKGTGRARAGTRNSPIWRGGGVTFGPKPRKYDYGLPKKQRRLAIRHALLSKLLDGETRIVQGFDEMTSPRTSAVSRLLSKIGINQSCLIGVASEAEKSETRNLVLSCRNIPRVEVLSVRDFNALSLLKNRSLLLTLGAFEEIQAQESAAKEGAA